MKIGVYAGSFSPFSIGHFNILSQSLEVFSKVIVAVGKNTQKQQDSIESFLKVRAQLADVNFVSVSKYERFLTDYINDLKLCNPKNDYIVVRGFRSGMDIEYEMNMSFFLKGLDKSTKIAYFAADPEFAHISSTSLRELIRFGTHNADPYIYNANAYHSIIK